MKVRVRVVPGHARGSWGRIKYEPIFTWGIYDADGHVLAMFAAPMGASQSDIEIEAWESLPDPSIVESLEVVMFVPTVN